VPLAHYGVDLRVSSLMVELRRDIYMDEETGAARSGSLALLASALAGLATA
jgi:hypothetical protein